MPPYFFQYYADQRFRGADKSDTFIAVLDPETTWWLAYIEECHVTKFPSWMIVALIISSFAQTKTLLAQEQQQNRSILLKNSFSGVSENS